jgi:ribosomal protein S14
MSEVKNEVECSICGLDGGPVEACEVCGGNRGFTRAKQFTRTEEIQGAKSDPKRYDRTGNVHPTVIHLPGSTNPYKGE